MFGASFATQVEAAQLRCPRLLADPAKAGEPASENKKAPKQ